MANIAQPSIFINYISERKKILVTDGNSPITQLFKVYQNCQTDYYFKIINHNNQTVSLNGREFKLYGSWTDAKRVDHIVFFTDSFQIENNVLHFRINTNTDDYIQYITNPDGTVGYVTIIETTYNRPQVVLYQKSLFYPRSGTEDDQKDYIVYRDILTGLNTPFSGSFGAGSILTFVPDAQGFLFGDHLIQSNINQFVVGQYNTPDAEQIFIIGNGVNNDNRKNLFTVNCYGQAYLSGVRVLTANDRTNVSELVNDIGYITIADVPVYHAGTGLALNGTTFSLTATIPSAVSQLTNDWGYVTEIALNATLADYAYISAVPTSTSQLVNNSDFATTGWVQSQGYLSSVPNTYALKSQIPTNNNQLTNGAGYITGYNAGSGITIENGTINCTVEGGGATYTAGSGISIDSNNVISLTATIPTVPTNVGAFTNDVGYLTAVPDTYALKSEIPLSTSQLVNNSNFISNLNTGNGLSYHAGTRTIDVTNEKRYEKSNSVFELNDLWIIYSKDKCTYDTNVETDNGVMTVKPLRLPDNTIDCNVATVELFLTPSGSLTGIQIASGLTLTNSLPKEYLPYNTQVFDINLFKNANGRVSQTISYKYQFDKNEVYHIQTDPIPTFSFAYTGTETTTTSSIVDYVHYNGQEPLVYQTNTTLPDGVTFSNGVFTCVPSSITQIDQTTDVTVEISASDAIASVNCNVPINVQNLALYRSLPFTIEAVNEYINVKLKCDTGTGVATLQYTTNGGNTWTGLIVNDDQIYLNPGEKVSFSGNNSMGFSNGTEQYYFEVTGNGKAKAYGNIMSLLTSNFENVTDFDFFSNNRYTFNRLFSNCYALADAKYLILPVTDLTYHTACYMQMFQGCGSLTAAPELPASALTDYCYYYMFNGCSALSTAPILPATQLVNSCYAYMFNGCSSLSNITVAFTDWGSDNGTDGWVGSVAADGIFNCPSQLGTDGTIITGDSYCPTNWTVVNV